MVVLRRLNHNTSKFIEKFDLQPYFQNTYKIYFFKFVTIYPLLKKPPGTDLVIYTKLGAAVRLAGITDCGNFE